MSAAQSTFTKKQINNWKAFRKVQDSGLFNMFDPRARAMTSMDREEWAFCMKHYEALEQAAAPKATGGAA